MTRRKGVAPAEDTCLKALLDSQAPVVTIVGKTWDLHVREVLGTTLEENLQMIADSVAYCKAAGREVFYDAEHFFDGFRHNPEYALQTLRAAQDAGAGGRHPLRHQRRHAARGNRAPPSSRPGKPCGWRSAFIATTIATWRWPTRWPAVAQGATQVQGTINGIGERCGNADLVSVIANLALKRGHEVLQPGSLTRLTEVSRYVYEIANMNFRSSQPFVGPSAFAHKGGMHAHAVAQNTASYEHIDPAAVGNERRILVSELSGQSTILAKTTKYQLTHRPGADGQDPRPGAGPGARGLRVRGGRGVVRSAGEESGRPVSAEVRAAGVPRQHRGRRRGQPVTEATVKVRVGERDDAHRQRGRWPGQRPGRGLAKGAAAVLSRAWRRCSWSITRCGWSTRRPAPPPGCAW